MNIINNSKTLRYPTPATAARVGPFTLKQSPEFEPTALTSQPQITSTILGILITIKCINSLFMIANKMLKDPFSTITDWCYVNSGLHLIYLDILDYIS